jgi:hypothetical protein
MMIDTAGHIGIVGRKVLRLDQGECGRVAESRGAHDQEQMTSAIGCRDLGE